MPDEQQQQTPEAQAEAVDVLSIELPDREPQVEQLLEKYARVSITNESQVKMIADRDELLGKFREALTKERARSAELQGLLKDLKPLNGAAKKEDHIAATAEAIQAKGRAAP